MSIFRPNSLKAALRRGAACTAVWLFTSSADVAEIVGGMGFSAVLIDREHSPGTLDSTVQQIRAIRAAGDSTVLVRVSRGDEAEVKLLLDLGVEGLLLPDVRTATRAEAFVAAAFYPPHGTRGAHLTVSRAADWGAQSTPYLARYAEEILLIAMIESSVGVQEIPAIAAVPGIDMLFLGPLDLSASINAMGAWEDPRYLDLQRQAELTIRDAGVLLGGAFAPPDSVADWFERGFSFVSVGSDVTMLRTGGAITARDLVNSEPKE